MIKYSSKGLEEIRRKDGRESAGSLTVFKSRAATPQSPRGVEREIMARLFVPLFWPK